MKHPDEYTKEELAELIPWGPDEPSPTYPPKKLPHPTSGLVVERMSDIAPKRVEFLWKGYLALGKISMFLGHGGKGKSQVSCYVASKITTGSAFFDGSIAEVGEVLFITAEDDAADTIVPRLMVLGADLSRSLIMRWSVNSKGTKIMFDFEKHMGELREKIFSMIKLKLIIIDPISAFMGKIDSNSNSEVRGMIKELQDLSEEFNFSVLFIHHFNKSTGQSAISRASGSGAFGAAARMNFVFGDLPPEEGEERKDIFVMASLKNNLTKDPPSQLYKIQGEVIHTDTGDIETSKIVWLNETHHVTAQEVADHIPKKKSDNPVGRPPQRREQAESIILNFTKGKKECSPEEYKKLKDIVMEDNGMSNGTFKEALSSLGYEVVHSGVAYGMTRKKGFDQFDTK